MRSKGLGNKIDFWKTTSGDLTSSWNDELLVRILKLLPPSPHYSLVCKRWMKLHGLLKLSIKVQEWRFLESGRMTARFPNLTDVDLTRACISTSRQQRGSAILLTHQGLTVQLSCDAVDPCSIEHCIEEQQLSPAKLDNGLKVLADTCPGLQRLCVVDVRRETYLGRDGSIAREVAQESVPNGIEKDSKGEKDGNGEKDVGGDFIFQTDTKAESLSGYSPPLKGATDTVISWTGGEQFVKKKSGSETGIARIATNCPMLQELELFQCTDETLRAVSACENLQIVRLMGSVTGFYHCTFTDIGLTIMSRTFRRLVSLELSGCEASYEGISAIGKCCVMLEELTLSNKGFYEGWVAAISFLTCLKTLRLEGCKQIDRNPGPAQHLGRCKAIERLQLVRCDLRDRAGFAALLTVCVFVRELEFQDCWGLDDLTFGLAASCKRIKLLGLAGCSLVTTAGLDQVVQACKDLQRLRVTFCGNIRDSEMSPALSGRFLTMKELLWRPDAKSLLAAGLAGTGVEPPRITGLKNTQSLPTFANFGQDTYFVCDKRGKVIVEHLANQFLENHDGVITDPHVKLNKVVRQIKHSSKGVTVLTEDGSLYTAEYAIATVSLGVLQSKLIRFEPDLPFWKLKAIFQFDMAIYTKIFLKFPYKFWPTGPGTEFFYYAGVTILSGRRREERVTRPTRDGHEF